MNKIPQAVASLSYRKTAFDQKKALRVFLCSDMALLNEKIMEHYTHRWSIEVMFHQQKRYMGFKIFMVRSAKAIDRLMLMLMLILL